VKSTDTLEILEIGRCSIVCITHQTSKIRNENTIASLQRRKKKEKEKKKMDATGIRMHTSQKERYASKGLYINAHCERYICKQHKAANRGSGARGGRERSS
jgi:hypothetical protein